MLYTAAWTEMEASVFRVRPPIEVALQPLGVVAAITPWNSNYGFICGKLATAIAAGCTIVIVDRSQHDLF
jgi:acyl-CoA reductase-like NAD-dependent aldehyde dehydrogenase